MCVSFVSVNGGQETSCSGFGLKRGLRANNKVWGEQKTSFLAGRERYEEFSGFVFFSFFYDSSRFFFLQPVFAALYNYTSASTSTST